MSGSSPQKDGVLGLEQLKPEEQEALRDFWKVYDVHYDEISDAATAGLRVDPELGPLIESMPEEQVLTQRQVSRELMQKAIEEGDWGPYIENLRTQGAVYAETGLSFAAWFRAVDEVRPLATKHLFDGYRDDPERLVMVLSGMNRFFDAALTIIGEEYLRVKERIISQQQQAIRELSTPVLQINDELLLLPMVGVVDSHRARQMTDQLLKAIHQKRARVVVIDITGVPTVDSMVANHLVQAVEAARLLGARAVVTGVSAEVAQTLVRIGVDLSRLDTEGDLQKGLEAGRAHIGLQLAPIEP
ncbi:MAG TPA: STAS domain-containing protein [Actinomycetota bacterium]